MVLDSLRRTGYNLEMVKVTTLNWILSINKEVYCSGKV